LQKYANISIYANKNTRKRKIKY